jgi:pyrroloquinoline quinone biosynthesis protein B
VVDASPDIREQLDRYLPPLGLSSIRAVFITHGHVGHYWGLPLLGKEGPDLKGVTVYAPVDVVNMLMATPAISLMESWKNIRMEAMCPGRQGEAGGQGEQCGQGEPGGQDELGGHGRRAEPVRIGDLSIEGFYVPHRQELTQTVGFWLRGPERTLIYIPDIDRWTPEVVALVRSADLALLDGTFFSADELGGTRKMGEIPHPPISESLRVFADLDPWHGGRDGHVDSGRGRGHAWPIIYFTHLNHTNPAGLDGPERDAVRRAGMDIAFDGMRMRI